VLCVTCGTAPCCPSNPTRSGRAASPGQPNACQACACGWGACPGYADGYVRGEAAVTFLLGPGSYVPGVRRAQRYSSPQQHVDGNEADSDSSETDKCASSSSYCQPALLDQPLAIISGTAINQDGRSSSLTAPSGPAQVCSLPRHIFSLLRTAANVNVVMCPMTAYPNRDPL
jgi:hypothetical protein